MIVLSPEDARRLAIVTKIRQAALYWEDGEEVNALLTLDEVYALMETELDGGDTGNEP